MMQRCHHVSISPCQYGGATYFFTVVIYRRRAMYLDVASDEPGLGEVLQLGWMSWCLVNDLTAWAHTTCPPYLTA